MQALSILNFFRVSQKPSSMKWLLPLVLMACASLASAEETPAAPGADDLKKADEIFKQNRPEALKLYQRAAEAGNSDAMVSLGYELKQDGKDTEAVKWYQKAAEAGNGDGMTKLGYMYQQGRGVTQSDTEAVKWYQKAAEAGNGNGMNNLGLMHELGKGIAQDPVAALKWYRKAADTGEPYALFNLGNSYENGLLGLEVNMTEAVKWYRKAAAAGNNDAKKRLIDLGL